MNVFERYNINEVIVASMIDWIETLPEDTPEVEDMDYQIAKHLAKNSDDFLLFPLSLSNEIVSFVAKHYDGGVRQFCLDAGYHERF